MYNESKDMAFKGDLEALVLGVLEDGESHGYEISKRIRRLSERALEVGEGQLYPALHALEASGLVSAEWVPQEGKPARKVYQITAKGQSALEGKRIEWRAFAKGVGAILTPEPGAREARVG